MLTKLLSPLSYRLFQEASVLLATLQHILMLSKQNLQAIYSVLTL